MKKLLIRHQKSEGQPEHGARGDGAWEVAAVGGVFVAALALRLWRIDFGLAAGYGLHPDEWIKHVVVGRLVRGESAGYFLHPGLMVNVVALLCRMVGWFRGAVPESFAEVMLPARVLMACVGALTTVPVFLLGRRGGGVRAGLLAASFLAAGPMHVVHSRYVKEDVFLVFFVVAAVLALVMAGEGFARAQGPLTNADGNSANADGNSANGGRVLPGADQARARRRVAWFAAAAICAGLAAASKFAGVVMLPFVLVAVARARTTWAARVAGCVAAAALALVVFVAASPQALDFATAKSDLLWEFSRGVRGNGRPRLCFWQWPDLGAYVFRGAIAPGLSWPVALIGLVGVVQGMRARAPGMGVVCAAAILWYLLAEGTPLKRGPDTARHALPCAALLCVPAAALLARWAEGNAKAGSPRRGAARRWAAGGAGGKDDALGGRRDVASEGGNKDGATGAPQPSRDGRAEERGAQPGAQRNVERRARGGAWRCWARGGTWRCWGRGAAWRWRVAWAVALLPLAHSLLISYAIEPDTLILADRWLARNGPPPPYRMARLKGGYLGAGAPQAQPIEIALTMSDKRLRAAVADAQALTLSSLATDRYERFPSLSRAECAKLRWLRGEFPHAVIFRKPRRLAPAFHNQTIEIRFRHPPASPDTADPPRR